MPPARDKEGKVYSATYSNVPVYEYTVEGNHVMRRRADDWINATHILKVADYDKPARTRILEREVQKGVHEKVQGGYGKYQGTWIPLQDAQVLAERNGVLHRLRPIFDYVAGDRSPPPAPKHTTAAPSKPRASKGAATQRRPAGKKTKPTFTNRSRQIATTASDNMLMHSAAAAFQTNHVQSDMDYAFEPSLHDGEETPDNVTIASESGFLPPGEDDYDPAQYSMPRNSKRRKIDHMDTMTQGDKEHQLWAEELLDYFMLQDSPLDAMPAPPTPPANANLDRPIDDKGHTALHWSAAMGDVEVSKDLIRHGARVDVVSKSGETPLMRAVNFTNSFDKQNMEALSTSLIRTANMQSWDPTSTGGNGGGTVFHHIAATTSRKSKYACARYYTDCVLNKMAEILSPDQIAGILDIQDAAGDTAITIAARNGARKCVRSLIGRNAAVDIPNYGGETADSLIVLLNQRRQERSMRRERDLSSSPFQGETAPAVQPPHSATFNGSNGVLGLDRLLQNGSTQTFNTATTNATDVYKSEAALTLTSTILPTLFTKTQTLATQLDQELLDKEAELAECERIATARQHEIENLQRLAEEWRVRELEQTSGGVENDEVLAEELQKLEKECEGLTELEQIEKLRNLIHERVSQIPASAVDEAGQFETAALEQKEKISKQLQEEQEKRKQLIREMVHALSSVGGEVEISEGARGGRRATTEMYRQLIKGTIGIKEEDIEELLPEIYSMLQENETMETGEVGVA
ncbi:apses-domain-containing protein [Polychaeton citri CBS 116435]|uniref:Apses-domain-containing protein n=1 Tax=Polychaeton citri CBS 116435 TaxID=1314669 RepID=A0A9P4QBM1_9PEZI|nr:apses-domain-containing protein [Polychaeton citri CBS 116435]